MRPLTQRQGRRRFPRAVADIEIDERTGPRQAVGINALARDQRFTGGRFLRLDPRFEADGLGQINRGRGAAVDVIINPIEAHRCADAVLDPLGGVVQDTVVVVVRSIANDIALAFLEQPFGNEPIGQINGGRGSDDG